MMAEFTSKSEMTRKDGKYYFSFFCDLCDASFVCGPIEAGTVKEALEKSCKIAKPYFNRCHICHRWVCDEHYNEDVMTCTACIPKEK